MQLLGQPDGGRALPGRFGPRPQLSVALPFRQLDQFPPAEMQERLLERCLGLTGVRIRQSRVASPESCALCLDDRESCGPPEAFIDGHEFCHIHPPREGSLHLTLPRVQIERVVPLGWAERHPVQNLGLFRNLVLVYGPRDLAELDVVMSLVELSLEFARGVRGRVGAPVPICV